MITTIWEQVESLHEDLGYNLSDHVQLCLNRNGRAILTEKFFIMGYPAADRGWFISCAVGAVPLDTFICTMPYYLPYIGWCRGRRNETVRWYRTERLIGKIMGTPGMPTPPGPPAAPTKDLAAKNLLQQGEQKRPTGFSANIIGDNKAVNSGGGLKTLLGS